MLLIRLHRIIQNVKWQCTVAMVLELIYALAGQGHEL